MQQRVPDECGEHSHQNKSALDEQSRIANRLALIQSHHVGHTCGIDVEGSAEDERHQRDEDHHDDHTIGRHVDEEVVERSAPPGWR